MSLSNNIKDGFESVAGQFKKLSKVATTGSYNDLTDLPTIASTDNCMFVNKTNTMTGSNMMLANRDTNDSAIQLRAGTGNYTGAVLSLIGNEINDTQAGEWELTTGTQATGSHNLRGTIDGRLLFKSKDVVRSINSTYADTSGNVTLAIPSKTSDLTNDSGYLTSHQGLEEIDATEDYVTYFNNKLA